MEPCGFLHRLTYWLVYWPVFFRLRFYATLDLLLCSRVRSDRFQAKELARLCTTPAAATGLLGRPDYRFASSAETPLPGFVPFERALVFERVLIYTSKWKTASLELYYSAKGSLLSFNVGSKTRAYVADLDQLSRARESEANGCRRGADTGCSGALALREAARTGSCACRAIVASAHRQRKA
jgi:hypothetical protein